jgi:hypothetical protein
VGLENGRANVIGDVISAENWRLIWLKPLKSLLNEPGTRLKAVFSGSFLCLGTLIGGDDR